MLLLPCVIPEYYDQHDKTLPTVEEFNAVWDVAWEDPPGEEASADIKEDYDRRVDLLTWYVESWLPKCVDVEWYGPLIRPRERLTSKVKVLGKMRTRVTVTREAYGFIQFENSRTCWIAKFKWDDEQSEKKKQTKKNKVKAPNYSRRNHEATKDFKCKWSDFAQGSQSKWDPIVYSEFELRQKKATEWRAKDAQMNCKGQDFAIQLSRKRQGITEEDLQPKPSKKRSRGKDSEDGDYVPPPAPKYTGYIDE